MRRILVTGSRTWTDTATIRTALTSAWSPGAVLVSGAARGADTIAERIWQHLGGAVERHPANWAEHGRAAGPIRNAAMVRLGADLCLAFIAAGSRGATDCVRRARAAAIPTRVYHA